MNSNLKGSALTFIGSAFFLTASVIHDPDIGMTEFNQNLSLGLGMLFVFLTTLLFVTGVQEMTRERRIRKKRQRL